MPTSILMPSLSPTMEEGVLAKWLVKEGDFIKPGTMLCSVETDKTTVDYESMDEGYLRKIILPAGTNAKVNQLIAILSDEKDENIDEYVKKAIEKDAAAKGSAGGASAPAATPAAPAAAPAPIPAAPAPVASSAAPAAPVAAPAAAGSTKSSPLARKLAAEAGIPVSAIAASGPGGRVIARDVEAAKANPPAPAAAAPAAKPAAGKSEVVQTPHFGSLAPVHPTRDVPLTNMRKIIGKRLLESAQTTPVFFVTQKIEMDKLNAVRAELNRAAGYKISVNDLIVKACSFALRQYPVINSSFHGEFIRENANIDICVAVAIPDGLITPIVRNADQKGLGAISQEIKALVGKAKSGKLAPEEFQGGTFTISNLGMFGVDTFTAIINPPQAAILAVGGTSTELYLDENGAPKERQVMKVTLSADHRVIDGAQGAQFVGGLKSLLENPVWLML
jgi:pyruvate dehydrogenase E2 component (dihydrolipoamide acetyltransferase)